MFDAKLRPAIDAMLKPAGHQLVRWGVTANQVTVFGGLMGLAAAVSIAFDALLIGLGFILVNRLADGLDGAVARASSASDFGGYLDIVFDFIFYSSIPFAFALNDPAVDFQLLFTRATRAHPGGRAADDAFEVAPHGAEAGVGVFELGQFDLQACL